MTAKSLASEEAVTPAVEEGLACTEKGPPNAWFQQACNDTRARPRVCARPGCPHHVHSWARVDARYCTGTCRMAVLRDRRRAS